MWNISNICYINANTLKRICLQKLGCALDLAAVSLNTFTAQKASRLILFTSPKKKKRKSLITTNRTNQSNFLNPVVFFCDRINICQSGVLIHTLWWNIGCRKEAIMLSTVFSKAKHDPRLENHLSKILCWLRLYLTWHPRDGKPRWSNRTAGTVTTDCVTKVLPVKYNILHVNIIFLN